MTDSPDLIKALAIPEQEGLVFACTLDGRGGGALLNWQQVQDWSPEQGPIWIHLDRTTPRASQWLREQSGLAEITAQAMLAEETRPRVFQGKRGYVAILRGVNLNPGADRDELVSLRLWSDGERVISVRRYKLRTPRDILAQLIFSETGPASAGELFQRLISRLIERLAVSTDELSDNIDAIEERIELAQPAEARRNLDDVRYRILTLRRFIAPQREALHQLLLTPPDWIDVESRQRLRETSDQLQRYVEELEMARERTIVVKDDIANRLAETLNRNMYLLSIISALFLPLGFVTGLLGINVAGIPGTENPAAFWIACAMMLCIAGAEWLLFRKLKWL